MNVLVIDVGGTHVKILVTGQGTPRKFPSGPKMTPQQMVAGVKKLAGAWKYEAVSMDIPAQLCRTGQSPIRTTWPPVGSGLILKAHSAVR